ncbi:hypothetical protein PF005_g16606 [Phytophthora fragariae]|uniref:Secreted protein n=1 Tax=Phytophthora fragariae TaxID=53985 RepID=A0A6A4C3K7_9STRA|nr:hypothetical protein PF003_g23487 [Phytophthora fragariae]KAE8934553.1 hypothetical protein PF009_g15472 [Phytophthora fragariae]KAE9005693.1 hypothetical protein PF011_g11928 [Phytophthora fragariae]KAE9079581.1 hypothetical protein PF007_g23389 [Phytophthora fragariae]KAE9097882.1 hypothetical protein PF010_g15783 [Phytophthora fragariae]
MVATAFGACVAAAVTEALGVFTCALPPTRRAQGSDGGGLEAPTQTSVLFTLLGPRPSASRRAF